MKTSFSFLAVLLLSSSLVASAQDRTIVKIEERQGDSVRTTTVKIDADTIRKKKKGVTVSIGSDGVFVGRRDKKEDSTSSDSDSVRVKPNPRFKVQWGMVDVGFNRLHDRTENKVSYVNPNDPNGGIYTQDEVFKLREGRSLNVNVWILNGRLRLSDSRRQKWYMTTGLGLQMYNFMFENPFQYTSASPNYPAPLDAKYTSVQKNKLGFTYASIPLGLLGKTRVGNKWLVYGGGVMGGMRIASWTKLKTEQFGKEKNHDPFNFRNFNAGVYGEVGLDDYVRLYGTYQLTPLNKTIIDQHPFAIGIRFMGL